jgi:hypothetical protein
LVRLDTAFLKVRGWTTGPGAAEEVVMRRHMIAVGYAVLLPVAVAVTAVAVATASAAAFSLVHHTRTGR